MTSVASEPSALPREPGLLATYMAREKAFRGIGPRRAAALAAALGDDLEASILALEDRVIEIVGDEAAIAAAAAMEARHAETAFLGWLNKIGARIPVGKAIRLARAWGPKGIEAVRDNPYLLLTIADWKAVDAIARATGVGADDLRRDVAAVEAALLGEACLASGSTRLRTSEALRAAQRLLGRPVASGVEEAAIASGAAVRLAEALQPPGTAHMEGECALRLARLAHEPPVMGITRQAQLEALLEAYEDDQPFPLTDMQRAAVRMAHRHRLMVLAGFAGSGKTTVLRGICDTLEAVGRTPLIVTLSGRAAKRASEATGRSAITVARFLIDQEMADGPLEATTALIADEASMLGLVEFWRILRRLGDASLLLCGDPGQLPPVTPGVVFHELVDDRDVARVILDRVHRQDEGTGIPAVAEAVRNGTIGRLPEFTGVEAGVSFTLCTSERLPAEVHEIGRALAQGGARRDSVQIIAPTNREIEALNGYFHGIAMRRGPALWPDMAHVAEGEPVIWTQNDVERGLTNGSMGRVLRIGSGHITAVLDGDMHELKPADGAFLQLAYAVSVHKAQGSQWQRVIVPVFWSRVLDRSLIYTALTRAQQQVIFLGDPKALEAAVRRPPAADQRDVGFNDWLMLARARLGMGQRDGPIRPETAASTEVEASR